MNSPKQPQVPVKSRLNLPVILVILVGSAVYLVLMNALEPYPREGWISSDPESQRLLANTLARTSVTLISTVFACLFLAIPITASMYTPQLIHIFVRSRANRLMLGLFVFSACHSVWLSRVAGSDPAPLFHLILSLCLVLLTLVLLLPYLFSVFRFLEPTTIIALVSRDVLQLMRHPKRKCDEKCRDGLMHGVRNLGNIVLRALDRADRNTAIEAVEALDHCAVRYLSYKHLRPTDWFRVRPAQFPGLSKPAAGLVERDRTWFEMELMLQLSRAYDAALAKVHDVISAISRTQRHLALLAAEKKDRGGLDLSLRFFNNFLREAVKSRDIHAIYDLLFQYRRVAERLWEAYPQKVLQIGEYLGYYARMALEADLPFAHDLVAYDLGHVITSVEPKEPEFSLLLELYLNPRNPTDGNLDSGITAGLFKARLLTAAKLLERGNRGAAERIVRSLKEIVGQIPKFTGEQLLEETEEFFWEVTDRQQNLDYVPPAARPFVREVLARL